MQTPSTTERSIEQILEATLPNRAQAKLWLLYERTGRWSSAIQSLPAFHACTETRTAFQRIESQDSLQVALEQHPNSCVTLELTDDGFAECLNLVAAISASYPKAHLSIVASIPSNYSAWTRYKLALQEASAVTTFHDIFKVEELFRHIERQMNGIEC